MFRNLHVIQTRCCNYKSIHSFLSSSQLHFCKLHSEYLLYVCNMAGLSLSYVCFMADLSLAYVCFMADLSLAYVCFMAGLSLVYVYFLTASIKCTDIPQCPSPCICFVVSYTCRITLLVHRTHKSLRTFDQ